MTLLKFSSVKERILVAFVVYSTISFAVSTTSFFLFKKMNTLEKATTEVNGIYNELQNGLRIGQEFFAYELNNEEFYLTESTATLNQHNRIIEEILFQLKELQQTGRLEKLEISDEMMLLKLSIEEYYTDYTTATNLLYEKGFKNFGLVGKMRQQINRVEEEVKDNKINQLILQMRRNETDYLLRKDTSYVFNLVNLSNVARGNILQRSTLTSPQKRAMANRVEQYYSNMLKIMRIDQRLGIGKNSTVTTGLFPKLKAQIANIDRRIQGINDKANSEKYSLNTRIQLILVSIVTLSIILTLFLSLSFKFVLDEDPESIDEL